MATVDVDRCPSADLSKRSNFTISGTETAHSVGICSVGIPLQDRAQLSPVKVLMTLLDTYLPGCKTRERYCSGMHGPVFAALAAWPWGSRLPRVCNVGGTPQAALATGEGPRRIWPDGMHHEHAVAVLLSGALQLVARGPGHANPARRCLRCTLHEDASRDALGAPVAKRAPLAG